MVYSNEGNIGESSSQYNERFMKLSVAEATTLHPGLRFSPTDEQLIKYYLRKKIQGCEEGLEVIPEVDVCSHEPWNLPAQAAISSDSEWYFFAPRGRKNSTSSQCRRATELGHWKATGGEIDVSVGREIIGKRRTLVFHIGRSPKGDRTEWILYQFCSTDSPQDGLLVCRLVKNKHFGERSFLPRVGGRVKIPRGRRVSNRRRDSQNDEERDSNNNNNNNNSTTLLSGGECGEQSGMLEAMNEVQNICSNQKRPSSELDHPESSRSKKSYVEEEEDFYADLLRDNDENDDDDNYNTTTLLCAGEGEGEQSNMLEDWKEVEVICLNKDSHSLEQPEDTVSDPSERKKWGSELTQPESSSRSIKNYIEEKEDDCYVDIMEDDKEREDNNNNTTTLLYGGEEQCMLEGGNGVENICSNKDDTVSDLFDQTMLGSELKQPECSKKSYIEKEEKEDDCFDDILKDDIIKLDGDEDCRPVIKLKSRVKNTTQQDKPAVQGTTHRRIRLQRYKLQGEPDLHSHDQKRSNVAKFKYISIFVLVLLLVLVPVLVLRDVPTK